METIEETRRKNLRLIVDKYGGVTSFSTLTRISPSQISQWLNASPDSKTGKPRAISSNSARSMETKCGFSSGWFDQPQENTPPLILTNSALHRVQEDLQGYHVAHIDRPYIDIPKSDAVASMGHGNPMPEHESLADYVRVNRAWVQSNFPGVNPAMLAALSAYGDSMEPTFSDGDTLIVDRGVLSIKIDAVYVLSLNDELFIKRLQRRPDGIMMISDNKNYQPYLIHNGEREKFAVLGRVIWAWNGRKI